LHQIIPVLAVEVTCIRSFLSLVKGTNFDYFVTIEQQVYRPFDLGCCGFLDLSGSVAHELSAFSVEGGKRRRA
jgi:hypothetical protein